MGRKMSPGHKVFLDEAVKDAVSPSGGLPGRDEVVRAGYSPASVPEVRRQVKRGALGILYRTLVVVREWAREAGDEMETKRRAGRLAELEDYTKVKIGDLERRE